MPKYKPIFARVLIEREIKKQTDGGIILPNAKRYASCEGKIVALGETTTDVLQVGQRVVFGRHSGAWLNASAKEDADDGTLFICQDEDILSIIEE
jgi:co-chaperonin GroES (HSP10)